MIEYTEGPGLIRNSSAQDLSIGIVQEWEKPWVGDGTCTRPSRASSIPEAPPAPLNDPCICLTVGSGAACSVELLSKAILLNDHYHL